MTAAAAASSSDTAAVTVQKRTMSFRRITDRHSLAGAGDQRSNHKDRRGPGPVPLAVLLSLPLDFPEDLRHDIAIKTLEELLRHPLIEALVQPGVLHDAVAIKPDVDAKTLFEQRG